jgi:Na+/H+ antiporter NhaD/arsenite permease-like protein
VSADIIALVVLAAVFLVATVRSVNMGALALVAAFLVALFVYPRAADADAASVTSELLDGFPGDLFVILVGVTYLFALAKNNGTVDWLVHAAVRAVRGKVSLIPWAMFVVAALITSIGAVTPAATAIIAPIAMTFAVRYRLSPVLMGFMVVQGATAGSFSPIGVFGVITNGVITGADFEAAPVTLFLLSLLACLLLCAVAYVTIGRQRSLAPEDGGAGHDGEGDGERLESDAMATSSAATRGPVTGTPSSLVETGEALRHSGGRRAPSTAVVDDDAPRLDLQRSLTLVGLVLLAVGALAFKLNVGFLALAVAVLLTLVFPASAKGAVDKVSWGTVLLIAGIVTYVNLLSEKGTITFLGDSVAGIGAPLLATLVICFIGALVSAFASTTGILGTLIPLSIPFLQTGEIGVIGLVVALAISSSVVDCSPFSTNGALVVANSTVADRDRVFKTLMTWGMALIVVAPLVTWGLLVVPGWL